MCTKYFILWKKCKTIFWWGSFYAKRIYKLDSKHFWALGCSLPCLWVKTALLIQQCDINSELKPTKMLERLIADCLWTRSKSLLPPTLSEGCQRTLKEGFRWEPIEGCPRTLKEDNPTNRSVAGSWSRTSAITRRLSPPRWGLSPWPGKATRLIRP